MCQRYHPKIKKRPAGRMLRRLSTRLALGELEPPASALLAVLLPFVLTGVPGQESELLQTSTQFGVEFDQGARDAEPGRSGLTRQSAAVCENQNFELVRRFGGQQRLAHDVPRGVVHEVVFKWPAIDLNLALSRPKE